MSHVTEYTPKVSTRLVNPYARERSREKRQQDRQTDRQTHKRIVQNHFSRRFEGCTSQIRSYLEVNILHDVNTVLACNFSTHSSACSFWTKRVRSWNRLWRVFASTEDIWILQVSCAPTSLSSWDLINTVRTPEMEAKVKKKVEWTIELCHEVDSSHLSIGEAGRRSDCARMWTTQLLWHSFHTVHWRDFPALSDIGFVFVLL